MARDKRNRFTDGRRTWSQEDIDMVMERKISDNELAKLLDRSVMSIKVKRCKVKYNYVYK